MSIKRFQAILLFTAVVLVQLSQQQKQNETYFNPLKEIKFLSQFEIPWLFLYYQDYCVLPSLSLYSENFWGAFMRQYGVTDLTELSRLTNTHQLLKDSKLKRSDQPRIPKKTHRVWITHNESPREVLDKIQDPRIFEMLQKTNQALEGWEHNFWVLDKKAIPRSVAWFEANGVRVREIKELPNYDPII